ncbi:MULTISPECIES: DUF5131 family protein [unclassified Bradyrhizobium]
MGASSNIEWTDATVNFWWGCTKVGPGCDHCYAETWSKRTGGNIWGAGAPRRKIKSAVALLHRLDNDYSEWAADWHAAHHNAPIFGLPKPTWGSRRRVFIQSMSDLFDLEVPIDWFSEAWQCIERCNRLELQIVTKRVPVIEKRLQAIGREKWPSHAGLIITVVNQPEADRDIPRLIDLKARLGITWVGLSIEPMLGEMDIAKYLPHIDWVIVGGESGRGARPMHPDWPKSVRDQCAIAGVPFLFKQWGEWKNGSDFAPDAKAVMTDGTICDPTPDALAVLDRDQPVPHRRPTLMRRVGKKAAGRLLDGIEHNGFPRVPA